MQHMTCLFTQANPEGIALKIYFTLCLIYVQENVSQTVATCLFIHYYYLSLFGNRDNCILIICQVDNIYLG